MKFETNINFLSVRNPPTNTSTEQDANEKKSKTSNMEVSDRYKKDSNETRS